MDIIKTKKLYPFQQKAFDDCLNFLTIGKDKSGLAILPTGAGKSIILAKLSTVLTTPTLFIVPSVDLLRQNDSAIVNEGGVVGVFCGSLNRKEIQNLTIATVASLKDGGIFKELGFKNVIVDEAHYKCSEDGEFKKFLNDLKPKKLLGLTATAFKLKTVRGFYSLVMLDKILPNIFKNIIHVTQVKDVIDAGRWSELEYEFVGYNSDGLVINSSATDYTPESIIINNNKHEVNKSLVKRLKQILISDNGAKTLIFTDSVRTAEIISEWMENKLNKRCGIVTDKTSPKKRKEIVDSFKDVTSDVSVLINFGTFTTGLDCPSLKYCLMGRPTMSFTLYYQIVGRLVRIFEGKDKGIFIDFCGNIQRFGRIEDIIYKQVGNFGWSCLSGERVMTGLPVTSNKIITEYDILNPPKFIPINREYKMPFGKFANKPVYMLPKHYREYLLGWENIINYPELREILYNMSENDFTGILRK